MITKISMKIRRKRDARRIERLRRKLGSISAADERAFKRALISGTAAAIQARNTGRTALGRPVRFVPTERVG